MDGLKETLEAADLIVSWMAGLVMGGLGLFWWADRRSQKLVDDKIAAAVAVLPGNEALASIDTDMNGFAERLRGIELQVAALPKAQEVTELKVAMASLATQMKATAEQVDTLYRAALAADRGAK
jgi:hypothetical protein